MVGKCGNKHIVCGFGRSTSYSKLKLVGAQAPGDDVPFSVPVEFKTDLVLGRAEELREKVTCHGPREWRRKTHILCESCVTFFSLSPFPPRCPSRTGAPRRRSCPQQEEQILCC